VTAQNGAVSSQSSLDVIRLTGELDIGRRDEIKRALEPKRSTGPILVDLSEVTYADSTVIAGLVRLRNDAEEQGRRLALLIGDARLARLLQYAGLAGAFAVYDDRATALTYLSGVSS